MLRLFREINPKVYILIKGEKDIKDKIEYIKKIDNDNILYKSILFSLSRKRLKRIDNVKNNYQCYLKFGQEDY